LGGILGRSSFSAEPCAIRGGMYLVVITFFLVRCNIPYLLCRP
jgi:hypothetical protein